MKVLKFGGTSVGTIESLTNVKKIVDNLEEPAIVVVSALGGLTDKLISTANDAATGSDLFREEMVLIRKRHFDIIDSLVRDDLKTETTDKVTKLLDELENRYFGLSLIKTLPESTLAEIVSFGERMSSVIVTGIIENAEHHESTNYIKTEKWFSKNIADRPLTNRLIKEEFNLPLKKTCVVGGFISKDKDTEEITNLGRGGSDYTAALIAAALDAEELEIWTDVDGFLTADPRIIPSAQLIPEMSFVESMELCSFGAKVIYPPTIYPVFHKNIPIKILNTFNPSAPGTIITDNAKKKGTITGISSLGKTALIRIKGKLTSNVAEINSRAYNAMARSGLSIYLVSPPSETSSFSMVVPREGLKTALDNLNIEFAPELNKGEILKIEGTDSLSVIAVVGEGIRQLNGLGTKLSQTLSAKSIPVMALSEGTSETTIALVVNDQDVNESLKIIHSICFDVLVS